MNRLLVVISFVVILVIFSVKLYLYQKSNKTPYENFPPFKSLCPDYWKVVGSKKYTGSDGEEKVSAKCENVHKIGICNSGINDDRIMDFTYSPYIDEEGDSLKCRWSKNCKTPWQGYSELC